VLRQFHACTADFPWFGGRPVSRRTERVRAIERTLDMRVTAPSMPA
jgi:hypothetical protein